MTGAGGAVAKLMLKNPPDAGGRSETAEAEGAAALVAIVDAADGGPDAAAVEGDAAGAPDAGASGRAREPEDEAMPPGAGSKPRWAPVAAAIRKPAKMDAAVSDI